MSSQQHQHYYQGGQHSAQDEVDAMLDSLVGPQPHTARTNVYSNNEYSHNATYFGYNQHQHYSGNAGPPPTLPPRNESSNYPREGSNKYYYHGNNSAAATPDNGYGYPPSSNYQSNHPLPLTPLPQRVSSVAADSGYSNTSIIDPTLQQNIPMFPMPLPHYQHHQRHASGGSVESAPYPPLQYHQSQHQRNPSQGTPPGSPPPPPHQQMYPPFGYPDATQEMINSSYRPNFSTQVSDSSTLVSTPSTVGTPPTLYPPSNVGGYRPNPTVAPIQQQHYQQQQQQQQPSRRNPSNLRNNMIMTIERPRYNYLSESENVDGLGEDGEMPFIPVSPDTDSDEDNYFTEQHHTNEPSPAPAPAATPSATIIQEYRQQQEQQRQQAQQQQQQQTSGIQYIDPSSFYMYPPPPPPATKQNDDHQQKEPQVEVMAPVVQPQPEPSKDTAQVETAETAAITNKPNYGFVSTLSIAFMRNVKGLENVRELWCASEYNESFTGSEAVTIIQNLVKEPVSDDYCILVCNVLMRSQPPLFSPTQYSQKSIISNCVNTEDTYFLEEEITESNVPQGVIPSLTPCYSVGCNSGLSGSCYSYSCPNIGKDFIVDSKVKANVSHDAADKMTSSPAGGWLVSHEAWSARMDREFLLTLDSKEIGRQEVLNETIYSEEKYLADLKILQEVVVRGIEESGAIEPDRRNKFINSVFNNYQELLQMSEAMFKDMLARYHQYERECVPTIGDILVQHMQFFEQAYVRYSPNALMSKYLAEVEIKRNPEFEKFTKEVAKHERTNRLPIWHYLLSPVTRMQRYPLLIEALLKKTPADHPDHVFLTRSHEIIRSVAAKADVAATDVKKRLAILHIRDSITFKQGEYHELHLDDPNRRMYRKGTLKRRSGNVDVADKNDIYAFVFDNLLLMTKLRKTNTGEEYRIWKKPIPLQLLVVQNNPANVKYQLSGTATSYTIPGGQVVLVLQHLGSHGGVYTFFCSSLEEKQLWTKAIEDAKASSKKRQGDPDVFDLRPLDDVNFRNIGSGQSSGTTTRVNCSVPFESLNKERKIAIGTENGVFFKTEGQDNSVRRIIQCDNVIQLAIMEKYHILIVLTEKALRAYPVDVLDSKSNTRAIDRVEVEIARDVNFFQIGFCNSRDMLVYKKKKNTTSVFTALEPLCDLRDPRNEELLTHKSSIFNNRPAFLRWFKKYKDFYIGAEASNIHFLKTKLNIVCERGFEIINPEILSANRDIPDSEDPVFNFVTRHPVPLKPLAMYRISDKFLLCYDKFAFYVNNRNGSLVLRGDKTSSPTICTWEGTPSHIVYEHPYIIAINPSFIEVRHVDTGELVQVIPGENIRLTFYNGGGEKPVIHVCMSHSQKPDTQALFHLALNNHRNSSGYNRR
ncbi:hypothetical protein [Parasitella parasitica]|uniref:DH domain-containing protein n=1 Tax=Parasitella parasitica TaxID=35722 RepID=A0A0B7NU94_9FUNG|nr:hypothetical protein [Parasitella parasitica]